MARNFKPKISLEAARKMLRGVGLRCTAARIAVIQSLGETQTPLSHGEVADNLSDFGFDKSTIYRSLTELDDAGLVSRLDLGDSARRFELVDPKSDGAKKHPHFICVACGALICMFGFDVRLVPNKRGQKPPGEPDEVLIKGHCAACQ